MPLINFKVFKSDNSIYSVLNKGCFSPTYIQIDLLPNGINSNFYEIKYVKNFHLFSATYINPISVIPFLHNLLLPLSSLDNVLLILHHYFFIKVVKIFDIISLLYVAIDNLLLFIGNAISVIKCICLK